MEKESIDLPVESEKFTTDFKVLLRYLIPLMEVYPNPINQAELSRLVGVEKPSVTRLKRQIQQYCNKDILAYESKMVLDKNTDLFGVTLFFSYIYGKFDNIPRLLESRYGEEAIVDLYKQITSEFDADKIPINEGDLTHIIGIVTENLKKFEPTRTKDAIKHLHLLPEEDKGEFFGITFGLYYKDVLDNFKIEKEKDVLFYLKLRDKLFHTIQRSIHEHIPQMRALKKLKGPEKRKKYCDVLKYMTDFYLEEIFNDLTNGIKEKAEGVKFPRNYRKIGTFDNEESMDREGI
jgi:hypothetical protein